MNLEQWQRSKKIKAEAEAAAKRTVERVLNTIKEPVMSEFKVGDKVVFINNVYSDCKEVLTVDFIGRFDLMLSNKNKGIELNEICGWSVIVRHATPEEIAAGHRIDNDMGEDFPIENHISPNCKVEDV
jgi:hypothetical protein